MRSITPAGRPVSRPGQHCAPAGAMQPRGLRGGGLPHQRARWFAMTDLVCGAFGWSAGIPVLGVRGFRCLGCGAFGWSAGIPVSERRGQDPRPTLRLRRCIRRAGARPRRAAVNLPGCSVPTHQAPEPVIARSAATWQSVSPAMRQHCTGREAGHPPGRDCAPAGARNPCGLRGNGLPRPLRGLAMTDLGVRCVSIEHAKAPGSVRRGRDPRPTVRATTVRKLLRLRLSHDSGGPLRPLPFSPGPCPCFPGGTSGRCGAGRAWWPC